MKISVVIPTYNRIALVERAIDSVLRQSIKPFDIIVVDDGSDDGTSEMIQNKYKPLYIVIDNTEYGYVQLEQTRLTDLELCFRVDFRG